MEKEKSTNFTPEFSLEKEDCIDMLKRNVERYLSQTDCTIKELSEMADIPFATLNNLLYSKTHKDCKISTAINLAKAMHITIDELLGGVTMTKEELHFISSMRSLPERTRYMTCWFLEYQTALSQNFDNKKDRIINVMHPICDRGQNLEPSNEFTPLDISKFPPETKSKVFMGLYLSCSHYMPTYSPYDILLIANDRPAKPNEVSVILHFGHIYLAKRIEKEYDGKVIVQYVSIRDGQARTTEDLVDQVFGYVVDIYHDLS